MQYPAFIQPMKMNETSALLPTKSANNLQQLAFPLDEDSGWGGVPELRKLWSHQRNISLIKLTVEDEQPEPMQKFEIGNECETDGVINAASLEEGASRCMPGSSTSVHQTMQARMMNCMIGTPGLLIATVLNLFLSMSFGQAFFPTSWEFPPQVPRAIGVQMFLFSTLICQLVMTTMSDFPTAMGMMMVENIPFMHIIAQITVQAQGPGIESFSTVFVAFALSSIVVGIAFYVLGKFKVGNAVYFFPRHVIIGCIGGIGVFIVQTGIEVSCDKAWEWSLASIQAFCVPNVAIHWLASVVFVIVLRLIMAIINAPLFPPFYFVAIPPAFYAIVLLAGFTIEHARAAHWFFPMAENVDPLLIWELVDFRTVNWVVIKDCIPTIIALSIFSLMHVPINIPSLSMSTHQEVDINKELIAHGYSNLLAGFCGGLQNYLCYSNSLLYFKCKGGGKVSGYLMCAITAVFFCLGPSVVFYMPRVMPGCLLIHIGIDLSMEALYDSWGAFDAIEYTSIVAITVVMTFYGMTAGLALGVLCATLTFTLQASWRVHPIRGKMCGRTLRSSRWRSGADTMALDLLTRHVVAIQLQGHIFFGNATLIAAEVEKLLQQTNTADEVWFIVLDFTLVVGIDSSAAETLLKIFKTCRRAQVRLCYCAGKEDGFPSSFPISETVSSLDKETMPTPCTSCCKCGASFTFVNGKCSACGRNEGFTRLKWVCQRNSLEQALAWCEDLIIAEVNSGVRRATAYGALTAPTSASSTSSSVSSPHVTTVTNGHGRHRSPSPHEPTASVITPDIPIYLHQIYNLSRGESRQKIERLMSYFVPEYVDRGTVLWVQGTVADRALVLISGRMQNLLEEEAGTVEMVYPGHLVGEYNLLNKQLRYGTLTAIEDCHMLVLHQRSLDKMTRDDPYSAFVFSKICMAYLGRRVMHVSNRIWESHCLPV